MKIYLAGENNKKQIIKVYLAENQNGNKCKTWNNLNILESYYYARKNTCFSKLMQTTDNILLDSGAYTFIVNQHKKEIDWDKYVEQYAEFINKYDVKLFFELDIDSIVGLKEVERLRDKLEYLTKKKSIPVWHKNRGKEYFIKMCKNYPYVALGGIAIKEIPLRKFEQAFPWFINTAHENNAKIHGLGYTSIANLKKYHFDSVDSTAWTYGNRSGYIYLFNKKTGLMERIKKKDSATRLKAFKGAQHNFNEFIKFSKYAEENL